MSLKSIFTIALMLISLPLLYTNDSYAQTQEIQISPSIIEIDAGQAGETIEQEIQIDHSYPFVLPINVSITPYTPPPEHGVSTAQIGSLDEWVVFEEDALLVESGDPQSLRFTIEVPEDIEKGSYFSLIVFQPILPQVEVKGSVINLSPYISSLLALTVDGGDLTNDISSISGISMYSTGSRDTAAVSFETFNENTYYKKINTEIEITKFFGEKIFTGDLKEYSVLPQYRRIIEEKTNKKIPAGIYNISIMSYDANDSITETKWFIYLPDSDSTFYFSIGLLIVIISSLMYVIKRYMGIFRKRSLDKRR